MPKRLIGCVIILLALSARSETPLFAQAVYDHIATSPIAADTRELEASNEEIPAVQYTPYRIPYAAQPPAGLRMEMSFAPPLQNIPTDPYQMGKYGRLSVDYTRATHFDGAPIGLMVQAMHVAHHLLFYSGGFTSDINNDGRFLLTAGLAHYQTGNSRAEPFVDAPFVRFRMQSMTEDESTAKNDDVRIYFYSEAETTMHFREYISGTVGLGLRLSPVLRLIGGVQHTEFVMPTERVTRMLEGVHGILQWGM
jgi:hypothetical protein